MPTLSSSRITALDLLQYRRILLLIHSDTKSFTQIFIISTQFLMDEVPKPHRAVGAERRRRSKSWQLSDRFSAGRALPKKPWSPRPKKPAPDPSPARAKSCLPKHHEAGEAGAGPDSKKLPTFRETQTGKGRNHGNSGGTRTETGGIRRPRNGSREPERKRPTGDGDPCRLRRMKSRQL